MYTAKGQLDVNSMLKQYSPLVRRLAHQMIAKLPANVELDDLIQVGMIGLTDALSRFDAAQGVQFETFATQRIRGAMLDELRGSDWMSRGDRRHQRSIETAVHKLEQKLGRAPSEGEIAKATALKPDDIPDGVSGDTVWKIADNLFTISVLPKDEVPAEIGDLNDLIVGGDAQKCRGYFFAGAMLDVMESATIARAYTTCQTQQSATSTYYFAKPRKEGRRRGAADHRARDQGS